MNTQSISLQGASTFLTQNVKAIGNVLWSLTKKIGDIVLNILQFISHYALIGLKFLMKGALALVDQLKTFTVYLAQNAAEIAVKVFIIAKRFIIAHPSQVGSFFGGVALASVIAILIAKISQKHMEPKLVHSK
ncbi:MAG: hypothetical protein WCP39_00970 [Chlamydiota bacterium]